MVTLTPAIPSATTPRSAWLNPAAGTRNAAYRQFICSALNAALCIRGDNECATGSPMMPTRVVWASISTID